MGVVMAKKKIMIRAITKNYVVKDFGSLYLAVPLFILILLSL